MFLPYTFTILVSILQNIYSEEQDEGLFPFAHTGITSRPLVTSKRPKEPHYFCKIYIPRWLGGIHAYMDRVLHATQEL